MNALLLLPPFQSVSPHLVMLCISKLINLLLSLPPLQKVRPRFGFSSLSSPPNSFFSFRPPVCDRSFFPHHFSPLTSTLILLSLLPRWCVCCVQRHISQ